MCARCGLWTVLRSAKMTSRNDMPSTTFFRACMKDEVSLSSQLLSHNVRCQISNAWTREILPSEALCIYSFPSSSDKISGAPPLPSQLLPLNPLCHSCVNPSQCFRAALRILVLLHATVPVAVPPQSSLSHVSFGSGMLFLLFNCLLPLFLWPSSRCAILSSTFDTQLPISDSFRWEDPFRPPQPPQLRVNVDVFWSSPVAPSPRVPQESLQGVSFDEVRWVSKRS